MEARVLTVEFEECKRAFDIYDKNGDGLITKEELGEVMKSFGQKPMQSELEYMINEIDVNGDGSVDVHDFFAALNDKKRHYSECEQELRESFRILDRNNDGFISASELHYVMTNLGEKLTADEIDDMIREADVDGDGRINYEEFAGIIRDEMATTNDDRGKQAN